MFETTPQKIYRNAIPTPIIIITGKNKSPIIDPKPFIFNNNYIEKPNNPASRLIKNTPEITSRSLPIHIRIITTKNNKNSNILSGNLKRQANEPHASSQH